MNPPENREKIAEIFFETFNVPGLYIGVQAVLALIGQKYAVNEKKLDKDQKHALDSTTGVVLDSGDGVTHVVPVCDGYVLGSCIKHIPIAGRKITKYMSEFIRDRKEPIPSEDLYLATMAAKEKHAYVCKDLLDEFSAFDSVAKDGEGNLTLGDKVIKHKGIGSYTKKPYEIELGQELFLGPEAFFSPEIIDKDYTTPIDELVDTLVQKCPIDYRRRLYSNIILSGGSTLFPNFNKRLQREVNGRIRERYQHFYSKEEVESKVAKANVSKVKSEQYGVWLGASCLADDVFA